ncbi:unnamed protein product [Closterium sp. NIES-54]
MYRGLGGFAPSTAAVADSFSAAFQCASDSPDLDTEGGPVRIEGARVLGPLDDYIEPDNNEHAELEPRDGHEPQQLSQDEVPRQQTRKGAVGSRFFGQQKSSVADSSAVGKGRTPTHDFRAGPSVGQDASMPSDRVRSVNGMLTNGSASNGKAGNGARSNSTEPVAIPRRTLKIKPLHQLTKPVLQPDRAAAGGAGGGAGAGEEGNEGDEKIKEPGGSSALVSPPLPSIDSFAHTRRLQSLSSFKPRSRLLGRQSQGGEVGEKGGVTATAAGASGTAGVAATGGAGNPSSNSSTVSFSSRASHLQQRQQPLVMRPFRVPRRLNANAAELSAREDTSCTTAATGASSNGNGVRGGPLGGRVAGEGKGVARDGFRRLQRGGRGGLAGSATAAAPGVGLMGSDQVEDEIEGFSVGEREGGRDGEGFGRGGMLAESSRGGGMEVGREGDGGMQGKRKRRKIVLVGSDGSDGDYEEDVEEEEEWGEGKRISPLKRGDDDAGRGAAATAAAAATFNARRFFGIRQPRDGLTQGVPQVGLGSSAAVQRVEREELRARLLALHAPSKGWRSARDPGAVEEQGKGTGKGKGVGKGKEKGKGKGKGKKGGKKSGKDRWEEEDEEEDEEDDWIVEDDIDEEIEEEIEEGVW